MEESQYRNNRTIFSERINEAVQECKRIAEDIDRDYNRGLLTEGEWRGAKISTAEEIWKTIEDFCSEEKINLDDLGDEKDNAYQLIYSTAGIPIKKVPVRYYPGLKRLYSGIIYQGVNKIDSLFNDTNPIGKVFERSMNIDGEELTYWFEVKREEKDLSIKGGLWEGWKCFIGYGKLEGYDWADGSVNIKREEGVFRSVTYQKLYRRASEPIWKKLSPDPVEGYEWIGIYTDIPETLDIPTGGFYYDATIDPPRGRHYKVQGILAYDDTEEIAILGIRDSEAEIVEIPPEINGKPVTVLDEYCFENCKDTIRRVILPDTIKEIGDYAFAYCKNLEKPVIPPSVAKIGKDIY